MNNYYSEQGLGETITYNQEDIPADQPLETWDTMQNIQGQDTLLVTIGDSWTWGDSLSDDLRDGVNFAHPYLVARCWDQAVRRKLCYGAHLSKYLGADWINYGFPGYSNIYILERFARALRDPEVQKYSEVYFVLCLTETGREWAWHQPPEDFAGIESDYFCAESEKYIVDKMLEVYGERDLNKLIICRNFTCSYPTTKYHTDHLKPWVQLNWEHDSVDVELGAMLMAGPATQIGIGPLCFMETYEEYAKRKHFHLDALYKFLEQSKFHHHKATKHPTAESHKLWAKYLYKDFSQRPRS